MKHQISEEEKRWQEVGKQVGKETASLAREVDFKGGFSWDLARIMQDSGLLRMLISKQYGGGGSNVTSFCLATEEVAKGDLGMANWIADQNVNNIILEELGTDLQRKKYFDIIINKKKFWCFSATEPSVGSDLGMMQTQAVDNGDHYIINGTKAWATTGGYADVYLIITTTDPSKKIKGLTGFVIEKGTKGLKVGREHLKMGWRTHNTTELILENVKVPKENRIANEGDGYQIFMCGLNLGRLAIAAQSLGLSEAALDYAIVYANRRVQFGRTIAEFQAIRFMLADMSTEIEASRALIYRVATLMDERTSRDPEVMKLACMAKYLVSDFAMKITTNAVQVLGATGYSTDHPVEKMMRDAKGLQIADGTNEIMRGIVASSILPKQSRSVSSGF